MRKKKDFFHFKTKERFNFFHKNTKKRQILKIMHSNIKPFKLINVKAKLKE